MRRMPKHRCLHAVRRAAARAVPCGCLLAMALPVSIGGAAIAAGGSPGAQGTEADFGSVQAFWTQQIRALGGEYRPAKLVQAPGPFSPRCNVALSIRGPFYCPGDETVYLDESFLQQVERRASPAADLAIGYVVAHEVAHHVQNVIGTTALVEQARARSTAALAARTLSALELQADCYAGLWVHWSGDRGTLKIPPEQAVSAALDAVAAVGAQWQSQRLAQQELLDPFTHGSAAQRSKWFHRGLATGQFGDCDTFGADAAGTL